MAYASSNQYGAAYLFGFKSTDAPVITGFFARSVELRHEPESYTQIKNAEGITQSVIYSVPDKDKTSAVFTGYITSDFDTVPLPKFFEFPPSSGDWYIVKAVSRPKRKGEFQEVSIETESYPTVTPTA